MDDNYYSGLVDTIEVIKASDTDTLFFHALIYLNTSLHEYKKTAFVMFQEIVKRDPNYRSPDGDTAYYYLGNIGRMSLQKIEWAIEQYTKAIEIDPVDFWSLHSRGLCWIELENWEQALSDLNRALNLVGGDEKEIPDIEFHIHAAKNKLAGATM